MPVEKWIKKEHRDTYDIVLAMAEIERDEGMVPNIYKDPGHGWACGVGRNVTTQGFNEEERKLLGLSDLQYEKIRAACQTKDTSDASKESIKKLLTVNHDQAMVLLRGDIKDREHSLDIKLPWWRLLSKVRQRVFLNMTFQMGVTGFMTRNADFVWDMERGKFDLATQGIEKEYAEGFTKNRAKRMMGMIRSGLPVRRDGSAIPATTNRAELVDIIVNRK